MNLELASSGGASTCGIAALSNGGRRAVPAGRLEPVPGTGAYNGRAGIVASPDVIWPPW
jgi:hypothetical protein